VKDTFTLLPVHFFLINSTISYNIDYLSISLQHCFYEYVNEKLCRQKARRTNLKKRLLYKFFAHIGFRAAEQSKGMN